MITVFTIFILLYSIIFHEIAHGYAAYRNGDKTAYNLGRLTLNPLSHIDTFGSIIIPFLSYYIFKMPFGWAKPVPYNPNNIKHKKYAELEVASAGILVNIFIAIFAAFFFYLLRYLNILSPITIGFLQNITLINLFLAFFNLLPFPPADGFSIFSELFVHFRRFFLKIKNIFNNKKEIIVEYVDKNNNFRNTMFHVKHLFSNPITMIVSILIAIQLFKILIPLIINLSLWLYSF